MRCIAVEQNQKRVGKKIHFFQVGDIFDFDKCPPNFKQVDSPPTTADGVVDFATIGENWLLQYEGDSSELAEFIRKTYKDAQIPPNATWLELVAILRVQRDTNIQFIDNTGKKENRLSTLTHTPDSIVLTVDDADIKKAEAAAAPPEDKKKTKTTAKKAEAPPVVVTTEVVPDDPDKKSDAELSQNVADDLDDLFKEN